MRLAWRMQRWELAFVTIFGLGLAALSMWQAFDMRSMLTGCGTPSAAPACQFVYPFQESNPNVVLLMQVMGLAPYLIGLLLGVPIVASEVEHRTALVSWPLAGSRIRWLAWRLVTPLAVGLLVLVALAAAADVMWQAYLPKSDLGFLDHGSRGVPLVMRGLLAILLGVVTGALVGRLLPALLLGIGLCVVLSVGLGLALEHWAPSQVMTKAEGPEGLGNPITTDIQYRMPNGEIIDAQEADNLASATYEKAAASGDPEPDPATLPQPVYYGISSARHPEVVIRESFALGAATLALAGLAGLIVRRRRPE